ncbi:MAG: hypothetical protein AAGE94_10875 [Acidobacteriota bacterium]
MRSTAPRLVSCLVLVLAAMQPPRVEGQIPSLSTWFFTPPLALAEHQAGAEHGYSLVVGDFNGDGREDFVSGLPFKDIDGVENAGSVIAWITGGIGTGELLASASGALMEPFSHFGYAMAAADLTDDGYDDLIIGMPGARSNGVAVGLIQVWLGGPDGLVYTVTAGFTDGQPETQPGRRFGAALVATTDAVFVGAPGEIVGGLATGAVHYLTTDPSIGFCRGARLHQDSSNVPGLAEAGDAWGSSLALADVDLDAGTLDLIVGAPFEDIGTVHDAGAVWRLSLSGIDGRCTPGASLTAATSYRQGDGLLPGVPETGDRLGTAVATGNFDGAGGDDLAIGVPREDNESLSLGDTGCVHIVGDVGSLACRFAGDLGTLDAAPGQLTGSALAAGDYNLNGFDDLAIGMPGADKDFGRQGATSLAEGDASAGLLPRWTFFDSSDSNSFANYGTAVVFRHGNGESGPGLDLLVGNPGWDRFELSGPIERAGRVHQHRISEWQLFVDGFESGQLDAWTSSTQP